MRVAVALYTARVQRSTCTREQHPFQSPKPTFKGKIAICCLPSPGGQAGRLLRLLWLWDNCSLAGAQCSTKGVHNECRSQLLCGMMCAQGACNLISVHVAWSRSHASGELLRGPHPHEPPSCAHLHHVAVGVCGCCERLNMIMQYQLHLVAAPTRCIASSFRHC
jgi:hypothetical protein